jgi:hypothetical protein
MLKEESLPEPLDESDTYDTHIRLDRWMQMLPSYIRCKSIFEICIPGSHDCGSFALDVKAAASADLDSFAKFWLQFVTNKRIRSWAQTQNISIRKQLNAGVRYFDFRVVYARRTKPEHEFRFCHALPGPYIVVMCRQINQFVKEHRSEVVIIDFQHFYNMTLNEHAKLIHFCKTIFGAKLCPRLFQGLGPILSLMFLQQRRIQVIIIYRESKALANLNSFIFWTTDAICSPFCNTSSANHLLTQLKKDYEKRDVQKLHVMQAILTIGPRYWYQLLCGNLIEGMAKKCNTLILDWIQEMTCPQPSPNIIMFDYVQSHDFRLIKQIILLNYRLSGLDPYVTIRER